MVNQRPQFDKRFKKGGHWVKGSSIKRQRKKKKGEYL
jgi:hypothetical protein